MLANALAEIFLNSESDRKFFLFFRQFESQICCDMSGK